MPIQTQAIFIIACSGDKEPGGNGQPFCHLGPSAYMFPSLHQARATMVGFYSDLPRERAGDFYKSGRKPPKVERAWRTNQRLSEKPTMAAATRYSGELYSALGWPVQQPPDTSSALLILSSMFGLMGPSDPIPEYELIMTDKAPTGGSAKLFWREALGGSEFRDRFIATFAEVKYGYLLLSESYYEAVKVLARGFKSYVVEVPGGSTGVSPRRWGEVARRSLSQGAVLPEQVREIAESLGCKLQRLP